MKEEGGKREREERGKKRRYKRMERLLWQWKERGRHFKLLEGKREKEREREIERE